MVEPSRVLVRGFDRLPAAVRAEINRVLAELDLSPSFLAGEHTLAVPRTREQHGARHDLAALLGRCLRPSGRRAALQARLAERLPVRVYPEPLAWAELESRAHAFADLLIARRAALIDVLVRYETHEVACDEFARTLDLMSSLSENRAFFVRRIGDVASFLPSNQPLYALACFGLVPALMARRAFVRPPSATRGFFEDLVTLLDIPRLFPNLVLSRQPRADFVAERARVEAGVPVTDAVIFTGTHGSALEIRRAFDPAVLVIVNGAGHNPVVVTERADLVRAVASVVRVQLYNQGQDCASPSAILVHGAVHDAFIAALRAAFRGVKVGPYAERENTVGPLTRRAHLARVQAVLVANAEWLDPEHGGVIRTRAGLVEPTIIDRPLALGGNFFELFAPICFVQRYHDDAALADYFEDPRYPLHAMYVTLFGDSPFVDSLIGRPYGDGILHDEATIVRDTDLHAPGVERGTKPYGGYGRGASHLSLGGVLCSRPTLPQRDLYEQLVLPALAAERDPDRARS